MKILPIALCLLAVVAPSALAAGLEGVSPTWGLGVVETGATLANVFELRNTSGQPVTLRSVRSSCSCAAVEWPRQAVPAGSSAWVRVVLKVPAEVGLVHKTVFAVWQGDDGSRGETVLTIKGAARSLVWLSPPAANFGVCRAGSVTTAVLTACSIRGTASVLRTECTGDGFRAETDGGTIRVLLDASTPGTRRGLLRVRVADGASTRDLDVPVFAHVQLPITVFPERIAVTGGVSAVAMARSAFGEPFKVLSCRTPSGVSAEAKQLTATSWRIAVSGTPRAHAVDHWIFVRTDLAAMPEFRIPLEAK